MTRILVLDGACGAVGASFGLLDASDGPLRLAARGRAAGREDAGRLPALLASLLRDAGWPAASIGLIAVVVGPGSFTGLRASLALAHGLALGGRAALSGVTVAEALGPALLAEAGRGETVWCASQARRDRVFIERPDGAAWHAEAALLASLPAVAGPVLVGGDAALPVAQALADRGAAARRSVHLAVPVEAVAAAALAQRDGRLPSRPVQPLYVDPPEARLPSLRAAPPA